MTSDDFAKSLLPPDSKPVAVTLLYRVGDGYLVITESAGLFRASPAAPSTDPWSTVDAAYAHSANVIAEHLARTLPVNKPHLALPDVSFDLEPKERP